MRVRQINKMAQEQITSRRAREPKDLSDGALRTLIQNLEDSLRDQNPRAFDQAPMHHRLGEFYEALGNYSDAAKHYSNAFAADRFYGPAYEGFMRTFK